MTKVKKLRCKNATEKVKSYDMFGTQLEWNIAGNKTVTSAPGLVLTALLVATITAYTVFLLRQFFTRENTQISQSTIINNFDSSKIINPKDIGFKFAWGIETTYDSKPLRDPNMVKWVAELSKDNDDTISNSQQLNFHLCTEEDYDSFYEPG